MFVMQTFTGRSLAYISWAGLPFFFLLLLGTAIIVVFPDLVTYLPNKMLNR
jgi:TRAP-type C4-dicarboxylate transport system permease large subunit